VFALFAEVIGLFFVYAAVIGNIRRIPAKLSRKINSLIFGGIGLAIFLASFVQIREAGSSPIAGIIVALVVVLAMVSFESARWAKFRGSDSWPMIQGTIESLDVKEVRTRSTHYFALNGAYSYSVNGEYYAGSITKNFDTESEASDFADDLRRQPVNLRYKPADAGTSRCQIDE
jgi:hypothetical protein